MTIELFYYIFLVLVTILLSIVNPKTKKTTYGIMFLLVVYSFIVRFSGFDADMVNYAEKLRYVNFNVFHIYFIKEWFYWYFSSFLYMILSVEELVFVFYDILFYILVYKVIDRYKLPLYVWLLYVLFFPSLMGMQNVFRQFIATSFLLYAIHLFDNKKNKLKYLMFTLAGFTHNLAFLFFPMLFVNKKNKFLLIISSVSVLVLLPLASRSKSISSTGADLTVLYLIVAVIILCYLVLSSKFVLRGVLVKNYYLVLYIITLVFFSINALGQSQAERVGMVGFQLMFPAIFYIIEKKFNNLILIRIVAVLIVILPTFIFPNALKFLMK